MNANPRQWLRASAQIITAVSWRNSTEGNGAMLIYTEDPDNHI